MKTRNFHWKTFISLCLAASLFMGLSLAALAEEPWPDTESGLAVADTYDDDTQSNPEHDSGSEASGDDNLPGGAAGEPGDSHEAPALPVIDVELEGASQEDIAEEDSGSYPDVPDESPEDNTGSGQPEMGETPELLEAPSSVDAPAKAAAPAKDKADSPSGALPTAGTVNPDDLAQLQQQIDAAMLSGESEVEIVFDADEYPTNSLILPAVLSVSGSPVQPLNLIFRAENLGTDEELVVYPSGNTRHMTVAATNLTLTFEGIILDGANPISRDVLMNPNPDGKGTPIPGVDFSATHGGIHVRQNSQVNFAGLHVRNTYNAYAGAIQISEATSTEILPSNSTVTVTGSTFENNYAVNRSNYYIAEAKSGGSIFASGSTLAVTGSTFTGGIATYGGGIGVDSSVLNVTGSSFTSNASVKYYGGTGKGGGVAASQSQVVIEGSDFTYNSTDNFGGAIYLGLLEDAIVQNCTIQYNTGSGAAIATAFSLPSDENTANLTLRNCDILDNGSDTESMSAISLNDGQLMIFDSRINGNRSAVGGAAIRGYDSVLYVDNTVIDNNYSGNSGGAMLLDRTVMSFVNNTQVTNNTSAGPYGGALYCYYTTGSKLVIEDSEFNGNKALNSLNNTAAGYGGAIFFMNSAKPEASIINGTFKNNTVYSVDGLASGGALLLGADTEIKNTLFDGNKAISENGQSIGGAIYVNVSGTYLPELSMADSIFSNNEAYLGGAIVLSPKAPGMNLSGTTFQENKATYGGALYVHPNNAFVAEGESAFVENEAQYGGAIYFDGTGNATLTEALFDGNTASVAGGGVYVTSQEEDDEGNPPDETVLEINGGSFVNNAAGTRFSSHAGGALYIAQADTGITDVSMNGVAVGEAGNGNTSNLGAGIYLDSGALALRHSQISANAAYSSGGGLYIADGAALTLEHTTIGGDEAEDGNTAITGAGIFSAGDLVLDEDGLVISNNATKAMSGGNYGGGIYANGDLLVENAVISNNRAYEGAGIYNYDIGRVVYNTVTLKNTLVEDNYAKQAGGGVQTNSAVLHPGTKVAGNTAEGSGGGGGLYVWGLGLAGTTFHMVDEAIIEDNTTAGYGGGANVQGVETVHCEKSHVLDNTGSTGGLYFNISSGKEIKIIGMYINGNHASTTSNTGGGGISVSDGGSAPMLIRNSSMNGNSAARWGGAIYTKGKLTVENSRFSGNSAVNGGAIYTRMTDQDSPTTIAGGSFFQNEASSDGGAIYAPNEFLFVDGTDFQDNQSGVAFWWNVENPQGYYMTSIYAPLYKQNITGVESFSDSPSDMPAFSNAYNNHDIYFGRYVTILYVPEGGTWPAEAKALYSVDGYNQLYDDSHSPYDELSLIVYPPTKDGYVLEGWYYNKYDAEQDDYVLVKWQEGDHVETYHLRLYANWVEEADTTYTVSFDSRGGSPVEPIADIEPGATISAPEKPIKTGYRFVEWQRSGGTPWSFDSDTVDDDITLYAEWELEQYAISYSLAGGTATGNPATYTIEDEAIVLNMPVRPGYDFLGWTGTGLGSTPVQAVTIPAGSTGDRSYTAHWQAKTYTVRYLYDKAGAVYKIQGDVTHGSKLEQPAAPSRTGYSFAGWRNNAGDAQWNFNTGVTGALTLYATWNPVQYPISYNLDGGKVSGNPSFYTIESSTFTLNNPTREGYTFKGWTGTGLSGVTTVVKVEKGSMGSRSYTATWEKVPTPTTSVPPTTTSEIPPVVEPSTSAPDPSTSSGPDTVTTSRPPVVTTTSSSSRPSSSSSGSSSAPSSSSSSSSAESAVVPSDTESGTSSDVPAGSTQDDEPESTPSVPAESEKPAGTVSLFGNDVPLGGFSSVDGWSLLNLVLSLLALLFTAFLLVRALLERKGINANGLTKIFAMVSGVLPLLLFLILENFSGGMVLISRWTLIILPVFLLHAVLGVVSLVRRQKEEKIAEQRQS